MARTEEALKRLGVDPEDLEYCPKITPILEQAEGGLPSVMDALRFGSGDLAIRTFLEKYDSISKSDRERVSWEAVALSANLDLNGLLGSAMLALAAKSANVSKIIAVTSHPLITRKRVEFAQLAGGERDRTSLDIMVGALPSAKGPTFIGKAIFGNGNSSEEKDDEEHTPQAAVFDDNFDYLFPNSGEMQDKLAVIRKQRLET